MSIAKFSETDPHANSELYWLHEPRAEESRDWMSEQALLLIYQPWRYVEEMAEMPRCTAEQLSDYLVGHAALTECPLQALPSVAN